MPNEIQFWDSSLSGKTLYATLRSSLDGSIRNVDAGTWDATPTAGELGNYDIALVEQSSLGLFLGNFPADLDLLEGPFYVAIHRRLGGSPAAADPIVGQGAFGVVAANVEAWGGENAGNLTADRKLPVDVVAWRGTMPNALTTGLVPAAVFEIDSPVTADLVSAVWAAGARTLTGFGTLIVDTWAAATRTLTSFGTLASDAGTDAAGKVLAMPAHKLATDAEGRVTVGENADKTGYSLAAGGLDSITIDGQTLVQAFQIVLAALSGNMTGGGGGGSGGSADAAQYVVNLTTARNNLAARLAEITASPKPSYSIDGQSVSWTEYQRLLLAQLSDIEVRISGAEPFEGQSQAFS